MTSRPNEQARLKDFFNVRATRYAKNVFVDYLFTRREEVAYGPGLPPGASILDVGCGTGRFYRFLKGRHSRPAFTYLGVDPAEKMLAASSIPEASRRVGDAFTITAHDGPFDRIYLLGVTTYLPDEALLPALAHLAPMLVEGGQLVVHFTNAASVEARLRQWLRPLLQCVLAGRYVATGHFNIYPRSTGWAQWLELPLTTMELCWLPASLPLLQYVSPRLAVWLSRRIERWAPGWLRMDFIVRYRYQA